MLPKDNQRLYWRLLDYLQWTCLNIFFKKVHTSASKPCLKMWMVGYSVVRKHQTMNTIIYYLIGCYSQNTHDVSCTVTFPLLLPFHSFTFQERAHTSKYFSLRLFSFLFFFLSLSIAVSFWNGMWPILSTQTNRPLAEQEILHRIYCISGSRFSSFHISPLSFSRL